MVLALLTASLVSIICFGITAFRGYTMTAGAGLTGHFLFGFFTTFLVALAQSMTMFYFIGTGKQVKDLVSSHPAGKEFIQRTKIFKAKVFPPATWAILFTMATMILGGGVHTRVAWAPPIVHTILAAAALYYNLIAFWREAKYMVEHNMLMEELGRLLTVGNIPLLAEEGWPRRQENGPVPK
ncbi:MAG: hypothetical protein HYU27_05690 [Acidobacteria bacterium]|nr:hypothetical protein [Acidobacteriota bacterium]